MDSLSELEVVEVEVPPVLSIQTTMHCATTPDAIGAAMESGFSTLGEFAAAQVVVPSGPPRAIYTAYDRNEVRFTLAFPIPDFMSVVKGEGEVTVETLPGGPHWRFRHRGAYDDLRQTYGLITEWLKEKGLLTSEADWETYMPMWEEYISEPGVTPEEDLITYVYLPRKEA